MIAMGIRSRDRERSQARRPAFRQPKPRILIVCEGEVTEPGYFDGFWKSCRNPRVEVYIPPERGIPLSLVRIAKDWKRRADLEAKRSGDAFASYDEVWCVYDVDQHPFLSEARNMADANGIRTAISNPCFELWLLLHFREQPGAIERDMARTMLKKFLPDYDKYVDYSSLVNGYVTAVSRASRLAEVAAADGESGRNPSTNVFELTESIRTDRETGDKPLD